MKKISLLIVVVILATIVLTGCYSGYTGEHRDLYTVAINSVLRTNGFTWGADHPMNSEIEILDQDQYGRTLFTYYENYYYWRSNISFSSLVICQSSNEQYAFYYEDVNFIVKDQPVPGPTNEFTTEEIEQLKLANDWNKPLNLEKCIKKEITTEKPSIPHETEIEEIITQEFQLAERNAHIFVDFLTASTVNENYIIYGCLQENPDYHVYFVGLVVVENVQIKEVHFLQPTNLYNYNAELTQFKSQYGWK